MPKNDLENKEDVFADEASDQIELALLRKMLPAETKEVTVVPVHKRIKEIEEKWAGADWIKGAESETTKAQLLAGPAGHGKSARFKNAAKAVSEMLGLEYREFELNVEQVNSDNDPRKYWRTDWRGDGFSCLTIDLHPFGPLDAGWNSGGSVLSKQMIQIIEDMTQRSGASLVMFEGFELLDKKVQEKIWSQLNELHLGEKTQLGVEWSSNGVSYEEIQSKAMKEFGVGTIWVQDTPGAFAARTKSKFRDEMADAGALKYLEKGTSIFDNAPIESGRRPPSPRDLGGLIIKARREIKSNGGLSRIRNVFDRISWFARANLGVEEGEKFKSSFRDQFGIEEVFHVAMNKKELEEWQAKKAKEAGSGKEPDGAGGASGASVMKSK